jgi:LysM repeat protein
LKTQLLNQAAMFSNKLAAAQHAGALPSPDVPPDTGPGPQQRSAATERRPAVNERYQAPPTVHPVPRSYTTPPRTHVVRAGETMATISRRYNIKLSALQFANPTVDARKLKPGQVLILPAR